MTRAARPALTVDVMVGSELWKDAGKLQAAVRRAVTRAAAMLSTRGAELAIVLTDDSAIRALNRDWRDVDKATNVLAFPTGNAAAGHSATSSSPLKPSRARPVPNESRSPIISPTLRCTVSCIWSATITNGPRTRLRWNAPSARYSASWRSRTLIGRCARSAVPRLSAVKNSPQNVRENPHSRQHHRFQHRR